MKHLGVFLSISNNLRPRSDPSRPSLRLDPSQDFPRVDRDYIACIFITPNETYSALGYPLRN